MKPLSIEEVSKFMYVAYGESTGGVSAVTGDKLPRFEDTPEAVQRAWIHTAKWTIDFFRVDLGKF